MTTCHATSRYGLRVRRLSKAFPSNGNSPIHAVRGLDVDIAPGEFVVIVGPNGSGKSTVLNILAGEIPADGGTVELVNGTEARDWTHLPRWKRSAQLARVYQDPRLGTAAGMTVWDNLRLATNRSPVPSPLRLRGSAHRRAWFMERLRRIGLAEKIDSRIADLSQGQRQLLAVELAMLREPALLLLDEHTASLDSANAQRCLETTVQLVREALTTVIMVTHNLMDALRYGDRLLVLRDGKVHEDLQAEQKQALELGALLKMCGYDM